MTPQDVDAAWGLVVSPPEWPIMPDDKRRQILLARLGLPLRRIEQATVRSETASAHHAPSYGISYRS